MDQKDFNSWYLEHLGLFERIKQRLHSYMVQSLQDNLRSQDKKVVHISSRIKSPQRLFEKGIKRGVRNTKDILTVVGDTVGICIVCKNLSDAEEIKSIWETEGCHVERKNYPSGYRAIHINIDLKVTYHGTTMDFPCEIQVKTLAQHTWSVLSHDDFYSSDDKDELLSDLQARIGDILEAVDKMSQGIRDGMAKRVVAQDPRNDSFTEATLLAVIEDRWPDARTPETLDLAYLLQELRDYSVKSVAELTKLLENRRVQEFLKDIVDYHFKVFKFYQGIDSVLTPEQQLVLMVTADFYDLKDVAKQKVEDRIYGFLQAEYCVNCGRIIHPTFFGSSWNEEAGEYDRKGILSVQYRPEADWDSDFYCPECFVETMTECLRCGVYTDNKDFCTNCNEFIEQS